MQKKKPESNGKATNGHSDLTPDQKIEEMVNRFTQKRQDNDVDKYFKALVKLQGSDLHMKVGKPPIIRVNGTLKPMKSDPIEIEEMARLLFPMMNERCLLYTSPSPRDKRQTRMPSSA